MHCKKCPECKKTSYSANAEDHWICPYCGEEPERTVGRTGRTAGLIYSLI